MAQQFDQYADIAYREGTDRPTDPDEHSDALSLQIRKRIGCSATKSFQPCRSPNRIDNASTARAVIRNERRLFECLGGID